jgi:site-specific recombinase XerD
MINRENWKFAKAYLTYLSEVKQLDPGTISSAQTSLRYVLEWSDETPFSKAPELRPTFPRYLTGRVSPASVELACGTARRFFHWLRLSNKRIGKSVSELWTETLAKPKSGMEVKQYNEYTLDEIRDLVSVTSISKRMKRDQAAIAFLFLSGMRIGAFSSMPIKAVDLDNLSVRQWPELGVRTKLKKKATTFLLDIKDLLVVVRKYDHLVRGKLPDDAFWYAPFDVPTDTLLMARAGVVRGTRFKEGMCQLCDLAGVDYRSPHNLRHGFAVYGLKNAKDIADMEAVSKNLMHGSLTITLKVYAVLQEGDVKARILNLGKNRNLSLS